jgi:hypothetical protein
MRARQRARTSEPRTSRAARHAKGLVLVAHKIFLHKVVPSVVRKASRIAVVTEKLFLNINFFLPFLSRDGVTVNLSNGVIGIAEQSHYRVIRDKEANNTDAD